MSRTRCGLVGPLPTLALLAAGVVAGCGEAEKVASAAPVPAPVSIPVPTEPSGGGAAANAARMEPDPSFLETGGSRTFAVTYTARVEDIPEGTGTLRVWVPVPRDSAVQTIADLSFDGPVEPRLTTERTFGNRLAYYEVPDPGPAFSAKVSYRVTRRELRTDLSMLSEDGEETAAFPDAYRKPDRLTVVDGRVRKMAAEAVAGRTSTLEKARALYGRVLDHMTYDKSGIGWGRGDTHHACDAGRGNCTDYHALFLSLCRAEGIAAGFEIGLYPPYERYSGQPLGGYHCWAWFRVPGRTWVPVDISEADRDPSRQGYFFGSHTSNRVALSRGRFYDLEPRQAGEPVNFLLDPYAEADGKPVPTGKDWGMKDLK